ncbi:hypothetical protein LOTGIDRAFT_176319 [Lottia gigantea]|uniref:Uncharacterized protein n=1 Tax=Lottia gigantea TaxID=225164 RepID=V4B192_LOTGI|nr:hypothetical protein LOTGIDRAFT_176319 [Lottia gigantea]ESO81969.1 hypothetical protein LOTGIDRAFT_176319 [Lottia gigantea]
MAAVLPTFGNENDESRVIYQCRSDDNILYYHAMGSNYDKEDNEVLRRISRCSDLSLTQSQITDYAMGHSSLKRSRAVYHREANATSLITTSIKFATSSSGSATSYPSVFSSPPSEATSSASSPTVSSSTSGSLYLSLLDLESTNCSSIEYTPAKPKLSSTDHCFLDETPVFSPAALSLRVEDTNIVSNSTPIHKSVNDIKFVFPVGSPIPTPRSLVPKKFEFPSVPNSITELVVSGACESVEL